MPSSLREVRRIVGPVLTPTGEIRPATLEIDAGTIQSVRVQSELEVSSQTLVVSGRYLSEDLRLEGAVCLPAFVDAHTHLVGRGLARGRPDLSAARSRDEAIGLLESWLAAHPGDGPVIAGGWDQSAWSPPKSLTGLDLDRLDSPRPLAARRVCGHVSALNRAALAAVGSGWPGLDVATGLAREDLSLALSRIWPPSDVERDRAVCFAQEEALAHGVAWVHEMGDRAGWSALRRAESNGILRIRVSHFFRCEGREALSELERFAREGFGGDGDRLRAAGIKLFLDGSIGARTAAVREPYPGDGAESDRRGRLLWSDPDLFRALSICCAQGWPIAVHAIGDAAVEQLLRGLEAIGMPGEVPPRIEHAEMLPEDLRERASRLGVFLSMQPNFTANWQGAGGLYEQVLGSERARALNAYRRADETGRLLFGSDHMPIGPLYGVQGALDHPDPGQRLVLPACYRAYTSTPATAVRHPFHAGRVAPGEPATLVWVRGGELLGMTVDGEVLALTAPGDHRTAPGRSRRPASTEETA